MQIKAFSIGNPALVKAVLAFDKEAAAGGEKADSKVLSNLLQDERTIGCVLYEEPMVVIGYVTAVLTDQLPARFFGSDPLLPKSGLLYLEGIRLLEKHNDKENKTYSVLVSSLKKLARRKRHPVIGMHLVMPTSKEFQALWGAHWRRDIANWMGTGKSRDYLEFDLTDDGSADSAVPAHP
jgi:hypothetical protein